MLTNVPEMDKFSLFNCCVIIPTYNNSQTLTKLVSGVLKHTRNIIVVNDGSTDTTEELLKQFSDITIVSYFKNAGKGYALKKGFDKALKLGYKYAITIDSDGQHNPDELSLFLDALAQNEGALIMGIRDLKSVQNVPSKNNFANNFSNFWFKLQTGLKLSDTQSGYRLYPLSLFVDSKYYSRKYELELEVLVRAAWKGINIISVPINVYYPPKEKRISHFRPVKDFLRISVLNFVLTTLAIVFYIPRGIIRKYRKRSIKDIIKNDILAGKTTNKMLAASIGFGVFMGIVPIWGYQLVVGFLLAHLFKMNKAAFFLAANISIPPFIPFILYLSYVTGGLVLGDFSWHIDFEWTFDTIKTNIVQYVIGSFVLAVFAGLFFFVLSYAVLPLIKKERK